MIVLKNTDGDEIVVSKNSVPIYLTKGYRIDIEELKEVLTNARNILFKEKNDELLSTDMKDLDVLQQIYDYYSIVKDIVDGKYKKYTITMEEYSIFDTFISVVKELIRIRLVKIMKIILVNVHSNTTIEIEKIGKKMVEDEIFIYISLNNFIKKIITNGLP